MCSVTVGLSVLRELIKQVLLQELFSFLLPMSHKCLLRAFGICYLFSFGSMRHVDPHVSRQFAYWGTGFLAQLQYPLSDAMLRKLVQPVFSPPGLGLYATPFAASDGTFMSWWGVWKKTFFHCCRLSETNRYALSCNLMLRSPTAVKIKLNLRDISQAFRPGCWTLQQLVENTEVFELTNLFHFWTRALFSRHRW